ncbi:hypothetical protein ADL30_03485 [Streptomyces sp. NRRL S-1521]|nr:hypothetical protein ADL30_03485 [Streptomyces sp. NRRL S-1521]
MDVAVYVARTVHAHLVCGAVLGHGVPDGAEVRRDALRHLVAEGIEIDGEVDAGSRLVAVVGGWFDGVQGVRDVGSATEAARLAPIGLEDRKR